MDNYVDVIRVVEGYGGAIERCVIEVPFRRGSLPDELVESAPVLAVAETTAFCGKIILVPPAPFDLWRQRLQVRLEISDQIAAHRDERLAAVRPERRDDIGRPCSPIKTGDDCLLDLQSIHQCDNVDSNCRLLGVPKCFTGKKARRA